MIGKESVFKKVLPASEVMSILEERKKRGDWIYEQQRAYEHAQKTVEAEGRTAKVMKSLLALGFMDEATMVKVVDIMPTNVMLLKQVVAGEGKSYDDEQIGKILEAITGK